MNPVVIDCSVAMAWLFEDESNDFTEATHARVIQFGAVVPAHWPLEVANVIAMSVRKNRISEADGQQFWQKLLTYQLLMEPADEKLVFGDVLHAAHKYRLTTYDAAYLELANRRGLELASLDDELKAPARLANVALFTVVT